MRVVVRLARPDGVLVELYAFVRSAAEDHGAHVPVADRESVGPQDGGLIVPESDGGLLGYRRSSRGKDGERHDSQFFHKRNWAGMCPAPRCTA